MGIDASIMLKADLSNEQINEISFKLGDLFGTENFFDEKITSEGDEHDINVMWRYYGIGYERGPLHLILAVCDFLKNYGDVYYGGNYDYPPMTEELKDKLLTHFHKHGHAPYLGFDPDHRCPRCNGPMWKNVLTGNRKLYKCNGCDYQEV